MAANGSVYSAFFGNQLYVLCPNRKLKLDEMRILEFTPSSAINKVHINDEAMNDSTLQINPDAVSNAIIQILHVLILIFLTDFSLSIVTEREHLKRQE